jgi:hypothetical protein
MFQLLVILITFCAVFFRSRRDLQLDNLALRQQLSVLVRKQPRSRLSLLDKLFWTCASPK